jgi:hypothetical protein
VLATEDERRKKGGREASTAVRRRDVAGSGPAVVLVVGALMGAA